MSNMSIKSLACSLFFFSGLVATSGSAHASGWPDYEGMFASCINGYGGPSKVSNGNCSVEVSDQAKLEITYLYKRLHAQLGNQNAHLLSSLDASQKAWIKYRDAHCKLESAHTTPDGATWRCEMRLNVERAKELRVFFDAS